MLNTLPFLPRWCGERVRFRFLLWRTSQGQGMASTLPPKQSSLPLLLCFLMGIWQAGSDQAVIDPALHAGWGGRPYVWGREGRADGPR